MVAYIQKPTLDKEAEDQTFNGILHYLRPCLNQPNQTCGSVEVSLQISEAGPTPQFQILFLKQEFPEKLPRSAGKEKTTHFSLYDSNQAEQMLLCFSDDTKLPTAFQKRLQRRVDSSLQFTPKESQLPMEENSYIKY